MSDAIIGYVVETRDHFGKWNRFTVEPIPTEAQAEEHRQEIIRAYIGDDPHPDERVRVRPLTAMTIRWNGQASRVDRIKLEDGVLRIETEDGPVLVKGSDERGHGVPEVLTLLFSDEDL